MIPRISARGSSFKGAALYFLHDPDHAKTSDRVAFTQTYNIPFDSPNAAVYYMIDTANDAEHLKREAGVKATGAKSTKRPVLTFSLSYDPQDSPTQEDMTHDAVSFMDTVLGLKDHQALIIGHNDTDHPHVHVMANLVHPETGRTHTPSWSKVKASDWALEKSKERGYGHCPQREINHKKRQKGEMANYKEPPIHDPTVVHQLYEQSDSGKAFRAAITEHGFTLAKGDRRGFVLVDDYGKIYSLSRQLKGQRAADIRAKFSDIEELRAAKDVAEERLYFDRAQQNIDAENKMLDAADEHGRQAKDEPNNAKLKQEPQEPPQQEEGRGETTLSEKPIAPEDKIPEPFYMRVDRHNKWEQWATQKRDALKKQQDQTYGRSALVKTIKELEQNLEANDNVWGRTRGKYKRIEEQLYEQRMNLAHADWRILEQNEALEKEVQALNPEVDIQFQSTEDLDIEPPVMDFEPPTLQPQKDRSGPELDF